MAKTPPRRVDFFLHGEDYMCAHLGSLGFSTRYIQTETKLGAGQINYRLKKAHVRRMDYRNGESAVAKMVLQKLQPTIHKIVTASLREL